MAEIYQVSEFKSMSFNVFGVKHSVDLLKEFPKMSLIKGFVEYSGADRNKVIRYVCYMYDKNSPIKDYHQDLAVRKAECARLSGFSSGDKGILEEVYDMKNEGVLAMINDFLIFQNERVWTMYVSNEQTFYEYQKKLLRNVEGDRDKDILQALQIKSRLMTDMDEINNRLESYLRILTGDDTQMARVIVKRRMITPESIEDNV